MQSWSSGSGLEVDLTVGSLLYGQNEYVHVVRLCVGPPDCEMSHIKQVGGGRDQGRDYTTWKERSPVKMNVTEVCV